MMKNSLKPSKVFFKNRCEASLTHFVQCSYGNFKLQTGKTLLFYILLAATPLDASSGTLNVFFLFKICNLFYVATKSLRNFFSIIL